MGAQDAGPEFLGIIAIISISLGVFNLLPFPVLDGGHLLLLGIEAIRNKRLESQWEARINQIGMIVLITLMIIIVYQDISQWSARAIQFE